MVEFQLTMRTLIILLSVLTFSVSGCSQASSTKTIDRDLNIEQFKTELAKGDAVLIDVRTPGEYASGHLEGSTNIDWSAKDYETHFLALDPAKPVLLYCQAGGRSGQAKEFLESKGYDVKHLEGGYGSWSKAGEATVK